MPFIPVSDTVLVEMRQRLFNQKIENTLYFEKVGGFSGSDVADLHNDLLTWWTTQLAPPLSDSVSLAEIAITDLSVADGFSRVVPAPTPNPTGGVNSQSLPGNVALCVSFRTLSRGRSFRGRNFVPGVPGNVQVDNTAAPTFVAGVQAAYAALPALAAGLDMSWVVVSRFHDGAPRTAGIATVISSVSVVDNNLDSQRRRLNGRGQ